MVVSKAKAAEELGQALFKLRKGARLTVRQLADQLGPVDLLVANAGVGAPTLVDPMNVGHVERNLPGIEARVGAVHGEAQVLTARLVHADANRCQRSRRVQVQRGAHDAFVAVIARGQESANVEPFF